MTIVELELGAAFHNLGHFLVTIIIEAGIVERESVAKRLEALAVASGESITELTGVQARANPHLLQLAEGLRSAGRPLSLIEGGRQDD
jgi:hypothetical protein